MKRFLNFPKNFNFIYKRNYSINDYYDICIVGGGPIGFGLASSLTSLSNLKSKKILLLESEKYKPFIPHKEFSNRTVALSPKTRELLEKCGVWKTLEMNRYNCVKNMFVWEQSSNSFITFQKDDLKPNLAYIVENDLLQHAIANTLIGRYNVVIQYETKVSDIDFKSPDMTITLANGSKVYSSFIVGADGFRSNVREQAGIKSVVKEYGQKAIVCVVRFNPDGNDSNTAWQRFTRNGPIAYLPLDSAHSNLIWSTTTKEADRLMRLDEESFIKELNNEVFTDQYRSLSLEKVDKVAQNIISLLPEWCGGKSCEDNHKQLPPKVINILSKTRATFPLGFMHATNYVADKVALVGDAAHRILPLAGQGVNLGFGDVESLSRHISEGVSIGETIGNHRRLQQYESERQRYVLPVAVTVQTLHELYLNTFYPVVIARAVGLKVVNSVNPLKKLFLEGATKGNIDIYGSFLK